MSKFYIGNAIPYVNGAPHIGHVFEFLISDTFARYYRLKGYDVRFSLGADEFGTKNAEKAEELGMTTQDLVDMNADLFKEMMKEMKITNDYFVKTTSDSHKKGAQKLWMKLKENGDIYKDRYEGLYCSGCEAYILEKDLVDGLCPNHKKPPRKLSEENYFFRLSKYSDEIGRLIETDTLKIYPEFRKKEILNLIKIGLKDVSFSRPKEVLSWGVEVPDDPDHVMYVWCDALSNYITALGYGSDDESEFEKFWPCDMQVLGKDILRFHAAIWIGMQLSAGIDISNSIICHGFITSEGQKMSKSLGNVVHYKEYYDEFGLDSLRYFLLREIPTTDDGDFSKDRFKVIYSSELANGLGNLLSRCVAMTEKYLDGIVPEVQMEDDFVEYIDKFWNDYDDLMEKRDLKLTLEKVLEVISLGNSYIEEKKPWTLSKEGNEAELKSVLYNVLELLRNVSVAIAPFIEDTSIKMREQLGLSKLESFEDERKWGVLKSGSKVSKGEGLFPRID